jgi:hypothetical protein
MRFTSADKLCVAASALVGYSQSAGHLTSMDDPTEWVKGLLKQAEECQRAIETYQKEREAL